MLEALVAFAQLSGAGMAVTAPSQPITNAYGAELNAVSSSEIFQAEQAARSGGAQVNDRYSGYTGAGYVEFIDSSTITWTVNVPSAGTYPLRFRYAVGISSRSGAVSVNNKSAKSLSFNSTGKWSTWTEIQLNESLSAGSNTIRLTSSQKRGANIDRLTVEGAGTASSGGGGGGTATPTPRLTSASARGDYYDLAWSNSGVQPNGGFDIVIDGTDTNNTYRTTSLSTSVGPLDGSRRHCFAIQARYTDQNQFINSAEVCVDPAPTGGGGGGGTATPTPQITSASARGDYYDLAWSNSGVAPSGGFDIVIDGTDTNESYRTTSLSTSVGPLDASQRHCFAVQARYTDQSQFLNSAEVCVDPAPTGGGGGGGGGGYPAPTLTSASGSNGYYDLAWTNGGVDPAGGFDIIVDGTDTNQANRTIWLQTQVGPLDESRTHCFQIQARYTDVSRFENSNELCVSPSSGGGGGSQNRAPSISGQPASSVVVGQSYRFAPSVSDPDGDPVTLSISNKPAWLSFNTSTGVLSGTPGAGDVATWSNIRITASDGNASSTLGPFSITVEQSGNRSVTLNWTPPTKREDGTALNNLRGYLIYVGQNANNLDREIKVSNAGISSYTVDGLTTGTWYLGVKAYDADNLTSAMSSVVSANVN